MRRIGTNSANASANDAMMRIRVVQTRSRIPILPYSSLSPPHWRILRVPPCATVAMATRTPPYSLDATCAAERTRGRFDPAASSPPRESFFPAPRGMHRGDLADRHPIDEGASSKFQLRSGSLCPFHERNGNFVCSPEERG
jgi:hypothetical protein